MNKICYEMLERFSTYLFLGSLLGTIFLLFKSVVIFNMLNPNNIPFAIIPLSLTIILIGTPIFLMMVIGIKSNDYEEQLNKIEEIEKKRIEEVLKNKKRAANLFISSYKS